MQIKTLIQLLLLFLAGYYVNTQQIKITNLEASVETLEASVEDLREAHSIYLKIFESHKEAIINCSEVIKDVREKINNYQS